MIGPVSREAEQALEPAVLEDQHEHAVGRGDRQEVQHDRLDRDDDRAERHQQQHERGDDHEPEHVRQVRGHRVVEVAVLSGLAVDVRPRARHPADRRRARPSSRSTSSARSTLRPRRRRRSPASIVATVLSGLIVDRRRHVEGNRSVLGRGLAAEVRDAAATAAGAVTSSALTTTGMPDGLGGERGLDAVERLHDGLVLGQRVGERRLAGVHLRRGDRQGDQHGGGERRRTAAGGAGRGR